MRWRTVEERKKDRKGDDEALLESRKQWHTWFAWHPVEVDKENLWFEKVCRRATGFTSEGFLIYEYKDFLEILKGDYTKLSDEESHGAWTNKGSSARKAVMGDIYLDTATNELKIFDGNNFIVLDRGSAGLLAYNDGINRLVVAIKA